MYCIAYCRGNYDAAGGIRLTFVLESGISLTRVSVRVVSD